MTNLFCNECGWALELHTGSRPCPDLDEQRRARVARFRAWTASLTPVHAYIRYARRFGGTDPCIRRMALNAATTDEEKQRVEAAFAGCT
jgi:hypothetical protein